MSEVPILTSPLVVALTQIRDYRSPQGRRYPLWLMLLTTILGVMSGAKGYQALEDFGVRHYPSLGQALGLSLSRLPSDTTLRRLFRQLDFHQLNQAFSTWATSQFSTLEQEWVLMDGKSIRGTVQASQSAVQNFIAMVSVYSHQRRLVLGQQSYENKGQSEIEVVRQLLDQLDLKGVVFSLDALHAQKNSRGDCRATERLPDHRQGQST